MKKLGKAIIPMTFIKISAGLVFPIVQESKVKRSLIMDLAIRPPKDFPHETGPRAGSFADVGTHPIKISNDRTLDVSSSKSIGFFGSTTKASC